jgi:oxygen-independent coproporphyrinogen III oxidase
LKLLYYSSSSHTNRNGDQLKSSLYIHIPFCVRKCSYCDFNSYENPGISLDDYVLLLMEELSSKADRFEVESAPTLYFGGGTPSLLSPGQVASIVQAGRDLYGLEKGAEVTLEVNPGTVTLESLEGYLSGGINRLSIGVQSFNDGLLKVLGRIHSSEDAGDAVLMARAAGFRSIGIDLIHSLPGQTLQEWEGELQDAIALKPDHISAYGLSVEKGTPFAAMAERGELDLPDEEIAASMFELTSATLGKAGFEQYEISNFARPGCRSRHNRVYWRRGNYLGFGAGAHSFIREPGFGARWENPPQMADYAERVRSGHLLDGATLSRREAMEEFFFLGLRLMEGVDLNEFADEFGVAARDEFPGVIERLSATGLLVTDGSTLRLSPHGLILSNLVLCEFV